MLTANRPSISNTKGINQLFPNGKLFSYLNWCFGQLFPGPFGHTNINHL
jgi:hypothetical protein